MGWQTIERPSQIGRAKNTRYAEWDRQYGPGSWRLVWTVGKTSVDLLGACTLYEDGYYHFLQNNPDILSRLISEASEVYDNDLSNIHSGFDYLEQESSLTHLQDIAIRRSILRMGLWFEGNRPIQIRGSKPFDHPLSPLLSPGRVPFHRPDLIVSPQVQSWWLPDTIESFYQSNRVLQVYSSEQTAI